MQRRQVATVIIAAVIMLMRMRIKMLRKWSGWRKDKSRVQQLTDGVLRNLQEALPRLCAIRLTGAGGMAGAT
jgi:hypothetical protein